MNNQEAPAAPGLTLFSPDDFAEMIPAGQLSMAERRANLLIERLARKDKGKEFTQITKLESKPIVSQVGNRLEALRAQIAPADSHTSQSSRFDNRTEGFSWILLAWILPLSMSQQSGLCFVHFLV
jgi:hypothetical protein